MPSFLCPLNLNLNELQNAVAQNLAARPPGVPGQFIFNTSTEELEYFDGTNWVSADAEVLTEIQNTLATGNKIADYTNEDGVVVDIFETITTVVAAPGSITYTSEDGTVTSFVETPSVVTTDGNGVGVTQSGVSGHVVDIVLLSTDADNDVTTGSDGGVYFEESLTSLTYDGTNTTLTFTDENGVVSNIDLSALTSDIFVNGATYNAASTTLTLSDNDPATPDVVVDLSTLRSIITPDLATGSWSHDDGNGTVQTILSTSSDADNQLSIGADGGSYLAPFKYQETIITAPGVPFTVTHSLDNERPIFQLYDNATGEAVCACVTSTGPNTLDVLTTEGHTLDICVMASPAVIPPVPPTN